MRILAITLGILASIGHISVKAQDTAEANIENWEINSDTDWNFSSDKNTRSVDGRLPSPKEYNLSESSSDTDLQLFQENHRWGNQGDKEDFSLLKDVYDY